MSNFATKMFRSCYLWVLYLSRAFAWLLCLCDNPELLLSLPSLSITLLTSKLNPSKWKSMSWEFLHNSIIITTTYSTQNNDVHSCRLNWKLKSVQYRISLKKTHKLFNHRIRETEREMLVKFIKSLIRIKNNLLKRFIYFDTV